MPQVYGDGTNSTIGNQLSPYFYQKKALTELVKEQYFSPLADVTKMPKNFGKKIKLYHYMPLLDDRNINDQGIDAAGVSLVTGTWTAYNVNGAVIGTTYTSYAQAMAAPGAVRAAENGGNLYGSSKDIGTISAKLPVLSETGGRVNRVGFHRLELEGTFEKFGFFDEYTEESLNFDSDAELEMHIHREMLRGAGEITEDALQIDLLNAAGTIRYAGNATSNATVSGAQGAVCEVDYDDLSRLGIMLDDNRTPKYTKVITGTRMVDTKVIPSARVLYIGSELQPTIERITDPFGDKAFIPVQHYAAAGNTLNGEIGAIGPWRIVVVPEMMHWAGEGAAEGTNAGYRVTNGKYDVFPMLAVGAESFTTIGFYTDGKSVKFKIYHKKPGQETADRNDPFGETGFMSIKWYYGFMALRPERIGLIKTVARV